MKPFTRLTSALLCLVLIAGCFAACGEKDPVQTITDGNAAEISTEENTTEAEVVIELGAIIDKEYTIIEIDKKAGTFLAIVMDNEDSYRLNTYTIGREYDLETKECIRLIAYARDGENRLIGVTYTDPKTKSMLRTESYSYDDQGRLLNETVRNEIGITVNSRVYSYNEDGSYLLVTSENGKLVSSVNYDKDNKVTSREDYSYADDGSYTYKYYNDNRLITFVQYGTDGAEAERKEYTYNEDGTFKVTVSKNGEVISEEDGEKADAEAMPEESTTAAKEVLDKDTVVTTTAPTTTSKNDKNDPTTTTKKNDTTTTTKKPDPTTTTKKPDPTTTTKKPDPTTTTKKPDPTTDASGAIDMLAQSKIFRSGEYFITGYMGEGSEAVEASLAVTPDTMYAAAQFDLGAEMGMGTTGMTAIGFLSTKDGYYLVEDISKTYCLMDEATLQTLGVENAEELFGDANFNELMLQIDENAKPSKTESKTLNGKAVTCYTFTASEGEQKHYVNANGELVRVEDYSTSGTMVNMIDISSITGNVPASKKAPPADYTQKPLLEFMLAIFEKAGALETE